jgi:hypothetical protein
MKSEGISSVRKSNSVSCRFVGFIMDQPAAAAGAGAAAAAAAGSAPAAKVLGRKAALQGIFNADGELFNQSFLPITFLGNV